MDTLATKAAGVDRSVTGAGRAAAVRRLRRAARTALDEGRLLRARRLYRELARTIPDDGDALDWQGVLEQHLGRSAVARDCLERAVALDPRSAQRRFHLAECLRAADAHAEALEHYRIAAQLAPGKADIWFGLASTLLAEGEIEAAVQALEAARRLAPQDAGIAALMRTACAEAAFGAGERLRSGRNWREAASCYRRALELDPAHGRAMVALGICLEQEGDLAAAGALYARATDDHPERAEAPLALGIVRAVIGDRDGARSALEEAIARVPTLGTAHYHLALLDGRGRDPAAVATLRRLLTRPDLGDDDRAQIGFALARRLDRLGEHDDAFGALRCANEIRRRVSPFDHHAHRRLVDDLVQRLDRHSFSGTGPSGVPSELPLLVVGMPRSGTTLVEQILAGHDQVHGAGERDDLRRFCRELAGGETPRPLAEAILLLDPVTARDLGERYVAALSKTVPSAERIVDKLPGNYLRLGLLARIAPAARVIWCRRDPLDTCLSCWFQSFADGQNFTYDPPALGLVYRLHERLMRHWQQVLPNPILEVRYEDLVMEPETEARRLVTFAGLDWQAGCLDVTANRRPLRTSSLWQAREPIHRRSIARWRHYEQFARLLTLCIPAAKREMIRLNSR